MDSDKAKADNSLVLAGDVGGTKTYLGLFSRAGASLKAVRHGGFVNSRYSRIEDVISVFLEKGEKIESACFGVACQIEGNRGEMTNRDWVVDGDYIARAFAIGRVELINDLVATGWGVSLLEPGDIKVLQAGEERDGNRALIAAGTGLGEAILFWEGTRHIPSASEGGHTDFAPATPAQAGLLGYLKEKHGGHVSYERVVSGPGLESIYRFLSEGREKETPARLKARLDVEDVSSVVSEEALGGTDPVCKEALDMFLAVYGAEAGNLALKSLPVGGLFVGGGIAPKILKAFEGPAFIEAFRDKGRFSGLLSRIPVYVILNDRTGLMGAARRAVAGPGGDDPINKVSFGR